MLKAQLVKLKIKNIVKSFLDEGLTPRDIRLQAAKGLIPLETSELITSFYYFLFDSEDDIKSAALDSIKTLPDSMLLNYLSLEIPSEILNYFVKLKMNEEKFVEVILLNKSTSTDTIKSLSCTVSEKLAQIIADNQERIIKYPEIIDRLESNPNVHPSLIEKLRTFLNMFQPAKEEREEKDEFEEISIEDLLRPVRDVEEEHEEITQEELEEPQEYEKAAIETPTEEELAKLSEEEVEKVHLNTYQRIQGMNVAQKVQEAIKGGKEARGILIKDSNKVVSSAVVNSPKITEDEIVKITSSKSISEEVLRIVCMKDEWLRNYNIKLNLVNNPKTPFKTTIRFMNFLRKKDLEALAKSKMVPSIVATTAGKLALKKKS